MNAEQLLQHFERISEAPEAIPRLRRFILDLAVRGKLVEQDPSDEPASELLKRIAAEKARLSPKRTVLSVAQDEVPFELPSGWSWSRIGEVCSKTGSGSTPRGGKDVYKKTGTIFLRSQNVYNDGLRLNDVVYIDNVTDERMSGTRVLPGDLLLNITGGSMGRCCLVPEDAEDANVSQHVAIMRAAFRGTERFLHKLVLSPYFQAFVSAEQTGAGRGGLPKNKMDKIVVALPPLAEQHRILAKVDKLMSLCDQLEAAKAKREQFRDRLVGASLQGLNQPAEEEETFREHARFTFKNLPRITTRSDHIKQLRQTILNLAVRGKLVEQDPSDESAAELLKRIAVEKQRLVKEGRFKSLENEPVREVTALPFAIPTNWSWCYLDDVAVIARGGSPRPIKSFLTDEPSGIPWIKISDSTRGSVYINETKERIKHEGLASSRLVIPGDLLLSNSMSYGYPYITNIEGCIHDGWLVIRTPQGLVNKLFLHKVFLSDHAKLAFSIAASGAVVQNLNAEKARLLLLPFPPLVEQNRIVAKVDKLMAICDKLEEQITVTEQDSRGFLESVLVDALDPGIDLSAEAQVA
jgi:type I restriction enzyme S subunit